MRDPLSFHWFQPSTWPWMIWVWIAMVVAGWIPGLWKRYRRNRAAGWPIANATIESAEVRQPKASFTSSRSYYSAELGFSYSAAGSSYAGVYKREVPTEAEGYEFVRELQGKSVAAHYDPGRPSRSVLLEPDIDLLLQARTPVDAAELANAQPLLPLWTRPFLWLFAGLAGVGLLLSLWIHVAALMGQQVAPKEFFWGMQVGIFVVWFPAVFVAHKTAGNVSRKDLWKVALKNCPDWMRYVFYGFFGYAFASFFLFTAKAPGGGIGPNAPGSDWRGFSAMWMVFYSAALGILYSAAVGPAPLRCPNGHVLTTGARYCARCGQPVAPRR